MTWFARRARALLLIIGFWLIAILLPFVTLLMAALIVANSFLFFVLAGFLLVGIGFTISFYRVLLPKQPPAQPLHLGVQVHEGEAPDLFAACRNAAALAGFRKPFEIWADLNMAIVSCRGKTPGQAARDIIHVGLPALAFLRPEDLRVLVAHPFYGRRLRSAVFSALVRTRRVLTRFLLPRPSWFAIFRAMSADADRVIAAESEAAKDRLAASVGIDSVHDAFARHSALVSLFNDFWKEDMQIVLSSGHVPPVVEGFCDRLEALRRNGAQGVPELPEPAALALVRSPETLEYRIVSEWLVANPGFGRIPWELAATKALLPLWQEEVAAQREALVDLRIRDLQGAIAHRLTALGRAMFQKAGLLLPPQQLNSEALRLLMKAMTVALCRNGWELLYRRAGDSIAVGRDSVVLRPDVFLIDLETGKSGSEEWLRQCDAMDIGDVCLFPS